MGQYVCPGIILLSSFYAWLMTATGIQLTQYRPAFTGWIGLAQPYVLAGLVHVAITFFYLRLSVCSFMNRRELIGMIAAAPFVFVFAGWTVFMSSYSIMYERRSETARVESTNQLQSISDELRSLDRQMATTYVSTMINLDQRLESEILRPEPGVDKGCGRRCKEIRAVQTEMQNYQHLRTAVLTPNQIGSDLGKVLGSLEGEEQQISARMADFEAALKRFSQLNNVLAERLTAVDETSSRLSGQFHHQLDQIQAKLADLRSNERNLTDAKYRGLTELVNDVSTAMESGQTARLLDLFTVFLIAAAPDFLSLIMALLGRSLRTSRSTSPMVLPAPVNPLPKLSNSSSADTDALKELVMNQLRATSSTGGGTVPDTPTPKPVQAGHQSIYEKLEQMDLSDLLKRRK